MSSALEEQNYEHERAELLGIFVANTDWAGAEITTISPDASLRRFHRLTKDGKTAVLMDARPPLEDTEMFEFMRNKLSNMGLKVPEIYAADNQNRFVIMEDFGDKRAYELIASGKVDLEEMYSYFVDVLVHKFNADKDEALMGSVAYSDEYWLFRVEQFLIHYMPKILKREVTDEMREEFLSAFSRAIERAHDLDDVLLHGDYGVNNLYYFPEEEGLKKIGIIDFQDMTDARGNMMGSPAFDLAFLLEDVRVELPQGLEGKMIERFLEKTGIDNIQAFEKEYATIAVAQATKCLGLFARIGIDDGREDYLEFIPYCLRNLKKNLPTPELVEIKDWFEKYNIDLG